MQLIFAVHYPGVYANAIAARWRAECAVVARIFWGCQHVLKTSVPGDPKRRFGGRNAEKQQIEFIDIANKPAPFAEVSAFVGAILRKTPANPNDRPELR